MYNRAVGKWLRNEALPTSFQKDDEEILAFAAPPTRYIRKGKILSVETGCQTLEQDLVWRINASIDRTQTVL